MWTVLNLRHRVLQSIFSLQSWRYKCFDSRSTMKYWRVLKIPFQNKNETFEMLIIQQRGNDRRGQSWLHFVKNFLLKKSDLRYYFATTRANTVFVFIFFFQFRFNLLNTLRNSSSSEATWDKYISSLHFSNLHINPPAWNIC